MPRDSSKILQEVSCRELGLRLHSPCVLFPAQWGLSHAQARLSRGPVTPKDPALRRRGGKIKDLTMDFHCVFQLLCDI